MEKHKGIILKVTRMYCEHKENREDLFQDIIIQLWQAYPRFKNNSKVTTWMYRVALNTAISRIRKEKKKGQYHDAPDYALEIALQQHHQDDENIELLFKAIHLLSDIEKAVVMLYMDDYSYKEMAEMLGTTESNIGFKINKIKGKLKSIVKTLSYGA